jgi:hypothetical protein
MLRGYPVRRWATALGAAVVCVFARDAEAQDPTPAVSLGRIAGTVYDSLITRGPIRGATVYVVGVNRVATSDARGRFVIDSVPHGEHHVTFSSVSLDTAGVQAPIVPVRVPMDGARVSLTTPSTATLLKSLCPNPRAEATGLLLGIVRDVDTGTPLRGARVESRWFELTIERDGPRYQTPSAVGTTDDSGVYRLCGVPADIPILVRATAATQESGRVEVYLSNREVAFRDFGISLVDSTARAVSDSTLEMSTDSTAVFGRRGMSTVRGAIRDVNGRPLANARVGLLDNGASVQSSDEGEFVLSGVPAGTQTLEVRALGYQPLRRAVTLRSTGITVLDVTRLDRAAQQLASIKITGARKDSRLTKYGFEDRRRRTGGFFMDADEIAKKSGIYLGDVLRFAPGVMSNYTPKGRIFTMRSTSTGDRCSPNYYLDGHRWFALDGSPILELERFMSLNDVAAVEVYRSGAGMPMQFDTGNGCGSVVFWTK